MFIRKQMSQDWGIFAFNMFGLGEITLAG